MDYWCKCESRGLPTCRKTMSHLVRAKTLNPQRCRIQPQGIPLTGTGMLNDAEGQGFFVLGTCGASTGQWLMVGQTFIGTMWCPIAGS